MKEVKEYELKSRIDPFNKELEDFIKKLPPPIFAGRIIDTYYDNRKCSLYQNGIFLRNRNNEIFELKFDTDANATHTESNSKSFYLPLRKRDQSKVKKILTKFIVEVFPYADDIFTKFGLEILSHIDKMRKKILFEDLIISIDEVVGLGHFIEIESDTKSGFKKVKQLFSQLNMENLEVGYVELFLKANNLDAYKIGKYKLKGDEI